MRAGGINQGTRDALFLAAHDIKGQAATFGFPLVAPVADSLCRLIEHTPEMARMPLALIDQHVDAIRAITTKNTRGDSEANAARLVAEAAAGDGRVPRLREPRPAGLSGTDPGAGDRAAADRATAAS